MRCNSGKAVDHPGQAYDDKKSMVAEPVIGYNSDRASYFHSKL